MSVIAIPVFGSRVSSRLDCAESILLVTLESGTIRERREIHLVETTPMEKIRLLKRERVSVLICGGLTEICESLLHETAITVVPWIRGEVDEVLLQFTRGRLTKDTPARKKGFHDA
jgi:predicted Fe-Mo cluster-binding NifX family protein